MQKIIFIIISILILGFVFYSGVSAWKRGNDSKNNRSKNDDNEQDNDKNNINE
tara:strand:- start:760 stop:918 length:159 start_codon:yes stop_codon:yes gene_type:complete